MKCYVSENILSNRLPKDLEPIYKLKLHETMIIEGDPTDFLFTTVMRVSGGWIYRSYDKGNKMLTAVFVEYNNEWMYNEKL